MPDEKPKILIVDDEPKNHHVYKRILQSLNLDIVKAMSGYQALEVAHLHDFFLILMDVQMPNMDGFETASLILDHPKTQHIPVIFVTAHSGDKTFEFKGYESGAVDYLTKPIDDTILRSKVKVFLQLWKQRKMLESYNEELNQLLIELSETTQALEKAKVAAEAAAKSKSDFLSNMTHELRSPLNSIIVLSRALSKKSQGMSERQIESAEIILHSGNDLLTLIDDILDLAKIEAGKIVIEIKNFNLRSCFKRISKQLFPLADAKEITLTSTIDDDVPTIVHTDEKRLAQIIRNLLSNAIKFTEQGGVNITVAMENNNIKVCVIDTGIGIDPKNYKIIFDAFQQEDSSTSRRFGGTGLGLNISRNMIKLLGGDIQVTSKLGYGSCFCINFPANLTPSTIDIAQLSSKPTTTTLTSAPLPHVPVADQEKTADEIPIQKLSADIVETHQQLQKKTLLLVDDDARNIFTLMAALEPFNFNYITAQNGQQALDKLHNKANPHIILMDLMMPVMDGLDAIKKIRENTHWNNIPIIVVTANINNDEKQKCKTLGANDFIEKPVNIDDLVKSMANSL
ncbi:MAG: hybrid sensor histidine kinase/response regulator [Moraxellaceae bacterium]|nr:MAG: hybrid sensor histidine kinase/response regulator [Moraxellaceae bacterium]